MAIIELNHLYFQREERTIINDVSWTTQAGEHWVLLGRNGCGKTTLLDFICGYLFPSSGKVTVLNEIYGQTDLREVRKRFGIISQSLFEKMTLRDPVWEVVATGEYAFLRFYQEIPQDVIDKAYGMLEKLDMLKVANQPLGTLSQGERKKILLARALMLQPEVLIMDEPCSGLDVFEREKYLRAIEQLAGDKTQVIYVTHHIEEIIPLFTHVAVMEQGRIIASGNKKEVLRPDVLNNAFHIPMDIEWKYGRPWMNVKPLQPDFY